jgi:hypothetical protein
MTMWPNVATLSKDRAWHRAGHDLTLQDRDGVSFTIPAESPYALGWFQENGRYVRVIAPDETGYWVAVNDLMSALYPDAPETPR